MVMRLKRQLPLLIQVLILLLLFPLTSSKWNANTPLGLTGFTCQGTSYKQGLANCPDNGAQSLSSGGNVTIFVKRANNLPNMDFTGPAAGVSDPYVLFTVGDVRKRSGYVRNNLNPEWNMEVNLGVLTSATLIKVEIWDYDIGAEMGDDLLVSSSVRVPFCSMFVGNMTKEVCSSPFGCAAQDSLWAMPERLQCNETGVVSFVNGKRCLSKSGICLWLDIVITPFIAQVEVTNFPHAISFKPELSVVGPAASGARWTDVNYFGNPFLGDSNTFLDFTAQESRTLLGALMFRLYSGDKAKGTAGDLAFWASFNFPATVYVCRPMADNVRGIPPWLTSAPWSNRNISFVQLLLSGTSNNFGCFYTQTTGTIKNRYGGVKSNAMPFYTNTIPGYDLGKNNEATYYLYNYIVLAIPNLDAPPAEDFSVPYDEAAFINTIGSYGLVWAWFMWLVARFLKKINFRIDRIHAFLSSRSMTGDEKTLLATLFLSYEQTPCNVEWRAHLFHAQNAIYFFLIFPCFLLIGWGFSIVTLVKPMALGFAVAFMGNASICGWFGFRLWETNQWRMSPNSLAALALSVGFFIAFIMSTIFIDVAVTMYGQLVNFAALSLLFGTLNTFPLLLVVFRQDKTYRVNLRLVLDRMTDAAYRLQKKERRGDDKTKIMPANKALHAILGSKYTINPKVPQFKFATVLADPIKEQVPTPEEEESLFNRGDDVYNSSLVILFVYMIIALARTGYPSLAFLNCITLITFDVIHSAFAKGDNTWTPGFKIFLLIIGRLLIMGSTPSLWMVNYSGAYLVYAVIMTNEMINANLPMLSKREAGEIAFAGKVDESKPSPDIAGTPYFCLGWLTFIFASLLLICGYGNENSHLPVPKVSIAKTAWPVYTFGVLAIILTITGGLLVATIRAFYLEKHGLLRGWAREAQMMSPNIKTPMILAIFTECAILSSGLLIYAITKSAAVLTFSIYVPLIFVCLGYAYREWTKNDFVLVVWPPKDAVISVENDNPSDLEVAFHMIENLFGEQATSNQDEEPESDVEVGKTLKGFKLPPLETTGNKVDGAIKMPPLPLKSVLRRKRQNLGIKVKTPVVKDLRGREGAEADKFGAGDDAAALVANDPWAQFGEDDDEEDPKTKKPKKDKVSYAMKERGGFMNHPYIVMCFARLNQNPYYVYTMAQLTSCWRACRKRIKKYSKVSFADDAEAESDDEDEEGKEGDDDKKDDLPQSENLSKMPFWSAFFGGYLSWMEYRAMMSFFIGMFAIMMMGVTLAKTVAPTYLGHVIWVAIWMFILTGIVLIKYFNSFKIDQTMKEITMFMVVFHFVFVFSFFGAALNGDIGLPGTLWITDFFFYFPAFLYMGVEFWRWREDNYVIVALDKDGDGSVTWQEYLMYFKMYPLLLAMMIILDWEFYLWVSYLFGKVVTLILLVAGVGYVFVRDWAINDFFLSPELSQLGAAIIDFILFITFLVSVFSATNPIFAISVFFFTYIFRSVTVIATRYLIADPDTIVYFSPYVMPVYSYNPRSDDIVDETAIAKEAINALLAGALWGAFTCTFLYPVDVGIAVACSFLLIIAAIVASSISFVPLQLGRFASMFNTESILDAAEVSKNMFEDRKMPLNISMADWDGDAPAEWEDKGTKKQETVLDRLKNKQAIELASDSISETRALTHVRDDGDYVASQTVTVLDDVEYAWYTEYWMAFTEAAKKLFELIPIGKMKGWRKHSESLFTGTDAMAEAIICGKGPLGWIGIDGYLFKAFKMAQENPRLKFLQQPWLNAYDEFGNNKNDVLLSEHMGTAAILARYKDYDEGLDFTFHEESRCAVHFLLLLIVGADARMQREQVLFQKFLRENRFRLASNGITPPAEIFTSTSYASIDIPLVAVWLSTLTSEERERFHMLKATFSEEQKERDAAIDASDAQLAHEAAELLLERQSKEEDFTHKINVQMVKKQTERVNGWMETLHPAERTSFNLRREEWMNNADCFVHFKEQALYDKFREAVMHDGDEATEYGRQVLAEIEAGQKDARLGEYGRSYQFVDSEYPPGDASIGDGGAVSQVLGWRCAPGVVDEVRLFFSGSDPNDVNAGIFDDAWLLSAISMLAAAGGVGDGKVDKQVLDLFVGHFGQDGELTHNTEVGAYCIRLYRQGMWVPVIVDDLFPMLKRDNWSNENRGLACAHAKECSSIWVPLLEKAMAKFYGSYSELTKGYVHHGLNALTGAESVCLPLSIASRGVGKRALWDSIIKYRKNGYIIGAGTGSSALVDKEIQDMGITFNAAYPIYAAWYIDGHYIIKLRNPPGDHDKWKGDWSDNSLLWNNRLRYKLGYDATDKNAFYISFDDFCNVFRYLYVCKFYDKDKWTEVQLTGLWKKTNEVKAADANAAAKKKTQRKNEAGEAADDDAEEIKRQEAIAKVDTSGGLPSKDNPGCVMENNPYYSLRIFRPTEVRITVSQADSRGKSTGAIHPFSIIIAKNPHPSLPMRLQKLEREDIVASCSEVAREKVRNLYVTLTPGLYMVLVGTYVGGLEGNFSIKLLSNYRTHFEPLWPPRWMLKSGDKNSEDVMKELALAASAEAKKRFTKFANNARKVIRELCGASGGKKKSTGGAAGGEEEEDEEDEDEDEDD